MKKYRANAATQIRIDYGLELVAGLLLFPETTPLAPAFETLNDELDAAHDARRKKRKELVKARVAMRHGNYVVDQAIRAASKAAEIADGSRRGPIFAAAFPEGVGPVVAPAGSRQVKPTEELITRITKSKVAGIDAYRAEWLPKLDAQLTTLKSSVSTYGAARTAYLDDFAGELALREEHYLAVDRLMGQARAAFPGDRTKQDLVFPVMDDAETVDATDEGGAEANPAPGPS